MFETKVVDKFRTHILYSITFFLSCAFCEIMWTNMVESDRPQSTI